MNFSPGINRGHFAVFPKKVEFKIYHKIVNSLWAQGSDQIKEEIFIIIFKKFSQDGINNEKNPL